MSTIRDRGESLRRYILKNIQDHPDDIVKITAEKFHCSRQAIHKHMKRLLDENIINVSGKTRNKIYKLAPIITWSKTYFINSGVSEDQVWREDIAPALGHMATNVLSIWQYGFTEMFNNAIEHSEGTSITVLFAKTASSTNIQIYDDGIGIFKKIQIALKLLDERHSVLELAKGKFTTDPMRHSGEGIFFTSRMFDDFAILSGDVYFSHQFSKKEDWILQSQQHNSGTFVSMHLDNHTSRTTKKVFDKFTTGDDYGFTKTVVPVNLTRYGDDNLVSRSQAKRLLARIDRFKIVVFDFVNVTSIGQAFADEVFRVFAIQHPEIEISYINANSEVKRMISRALTHENAMDDNSAKAT